MRIHSLQHVPFEGLGSLEGSLLNLGHTLSRTRVFLNEPFPNGDEFDALIVMGGPMGANDDHQLSWLGPEKAFIRRSIDEGKRVLGICLGAQLIAAVLGARVFPNAHREIGWYPIHSTPDAATTPLGILPPAMPVFHWHGDTFDLPPGAVRLAVSDACINQAFAIGQRVLALQFHLEMTATGAQSLIKECPNDLAAGSFVQTPAEMLANPERFDHINQLMAGIVRSFLSETTAR